MPSNSSDPEPPYITALRGVSCDVVASVTFDQRLSHFLRLPPILDRLQAALPEDRARAVQFLREDDDVDDDNARRSHLLTRFHDFVFEDEMRSVDGASMESFVRFSAILLDESVTHFDDTVNGVAEKSLDACFRCLFILQNEKDGEAVDDGIEERVTRFERCAKMFEKAVKSHCAELCSLVLINEDFFRIVITDNPVVSILAVSLFSLCIRHPSCQLSHLPESTLLGFLDELSFKVSSTENSLDAKTAIEALLSVAENGAQFVDLLRQRYEGLGTLITRWASRGFDPLIRRLLSLLDSSTPQPSDATQQTSAAIVIQRSWRGHATRRRMSKLSRIVARVQRNFRRRRAEATKIRVDAEAAQRRSAVIEEERLRHMRQSREAALRSVEALPARDVDEFLRRQEGDAATKIQALWKGWRTRRKLSDVTCGREEMKREAAARVIQRHWRFWLKNARAKKRASRLKAEDAAKTQRREILAAEVEKRKEKRLKEIAGRSRREKAPLSHDEMSDLDERVQEMIWRKNARKSQVARSLQRCEATLASLDMDLDVILYPSSLDELVAGVQAAVDPQYRQLLTPSTSASVRSIAAVEHSKAVRHAREPWRKLLEEDPCDEDDELFVVEGKLDEMTKKQFRDNPHWKHLSWTLDDNEDPW